MTSGLLENVQMCLLFQVVTRYFMIYFDNFSKLGFVFFLIKLYIKKYDIVNLKCLLLLLGLS